MTTIDFSICDNYVEISVIGHSGYGVSGNDIVCSAVSILTFSLYSYLTSASDRKYVDQLEVKMDEADITLKFFVIDNSVYEAVMQTLLGFELLEENYGKYVHYSPKGRELLEAIK